MHAYIHAHIHTYIHTYTHMHAHIHAYITTWMLHARLGGGHGARRGVGGDGLGLQKIACVSCGPTTSVSRVTLT